MFYTKSGFCIRCGKCCKPPVVIETPCIERGEDRCKFYIEIDNGELYGHCLIYGRGNKPMEVVKNRLGDTITKEQIRWFKENCIEYPAVSDIEKGHKLPAECSFVFEAVG